MSPTPGARLAHYEIVETIGKGGMGEVYRARDTRLPRDAAIKVSADAIACASRANRSLNCRQGDAVHGGAQLGRSAPEVTD
jgi:hypothetical protein